MEKESIKFSHIMGMIKRRSAMMFFTFLTSLSLSLLVAFGLPPVYESEGVILVEQEYIPDDLVRSTITGYADERIQVISQRVMATDNLASLIKEYGLYDSGNPDISAMDRVSEMRNAILVEPISADVVDPRSGRPMKATIAFSVTYENTDPDTARDVARALTNLFLKENQRSRSEQVEEAVSFLEAQMEVWEGNSATFADQLAQFKQQYQGILPENAQFNQQRMERDERRLSDLRNEIRQLEERVRYLLTDRRRMVEEVGGSVDRMAELQSEYSRVTALYAPDHPDVLRIKKEINTLMQAGVGAGSDATAEIERVKTELAVARERYTGDHPDVKRLQRMLEQLEAAPKELSNSSRFSSSPTVRMIDTEILETNSRLSALRQERDELQAEIDQMQILMRDIPEVERQYRVISRRYEGAVAQYDEIRQKLSTAQLASKLETEQMGERFSVIEKPRMPQEPSRPNRIGILFLGIVLSSVLVVAFLALAEVSDRSVRNTRDVVEILGIPPLATIPYVDNSIDRRHRITRRAIYAAVAGVLILGTYGGLQTF